VPSGRNICPRCSLPLRFATVLCFAAATGDNYLANNRSVVRRLLVSILGSREIPFPGSGKKSRLETLGSCLSDFVGYYLLSAHSSVDAVV